MDIRLRDVGWTRDAQRLTGEVLGELALDQCRRQVSDATSQLSDLAVELRMFQRIASDNTTYIMIFVYDDVRRYCMPHGDSFPLVYAGRRRRIDRRDSTAAYSTELFQVSTDVP